MKNKIIIAVVIGYLCINADCSSKKQPDPPNPNPPAPPVTSGITAWITTGDRANLLQKQPNLIGFTSSTNSNPTVEVDSTITYQSIDGFGYTLTGGSAYHINRLSASQRSSLLQELFGSRETSIGISYLRV